MIPTLHATPREALVAWRRSAGYTQPEVAALFGVSKGAVGWWESGRCRVPARVQAQLRKEGWLPQQRRVYRPPLNHDPLCPPTQPCRSCNLRRKRAAWGSRWAIPAYVWTPEAEARLAVLARTHTLREMAEQISAEFGVPRTYGAIRQRLRERGIQDCARPLTPQVVARLCGTTTSTVQKWIRRGWLPTRQAGGVWHPHTIAPSDFAAFLDASAVWVDWRQMPPSSWRDRAEMAWRRDPLYSLEEATAWLPLGVMTIRRYCRSGALPAIRVITRGGGGMSWRVRRSALVQFIAEHPVQRRSA